MERAGELPRLFLCPAGDLRQLQNRTRREDTDSRLLRKGTAVCSHFRRGAGWAGRMRKERPKAFGTAVRRRKWSRLSPGAHSVDEWTGQSEGTSGQEADRRQDAAPFVPPCSILSGTQPLSGRWRMIPSFCPVSCSRCGRSFIVPGPRGHICPQCQKERHESGKIACQKPPNHPDDQNAGTDERDEARSSRAVEPVPQPHLCNLWNPAGRTCLTRGMLATCPRMHLAARSRLPCGERSECFGLSRCQFVPQNRPLRRTFF